MDEHGCPWLRRSANRISERDGDKGETTKERMNWAEEGWRIGGAETVAQR